jgi:hypothetical protein
LEKLKMVKGNGDRRRELAAMRKHDQQQESLRKKAGPAKATPTEVRAILLDLSTKGLLSEGKEELKVWLVSKQESADELPETCLFFLRTGDCSLKKCKYKHVQSLCKLKNMQEPLEGGGLGLPPLDQILLVKFTDTGDSQVYDRRLRTKIRRSSPLRFIEYQGECIYDFQYPHVFAEFVNRFRKEELHPEDLPPSPAHNEVAEGTSEENVMVV